MKYLSRLFSPKIRILWGALTILCLAYSLMVFLVASGTMSFTIWLAAAAFFGLCFYLAGEGRWLKIPKGIRTVAYLVIGIIALAFVICQIAILSHFFDKGEPDLDYVIVLGAQMRESGPSVIYRYRLEKACAYLEDNKDTICITTGGTGPNENISEGEGGKDYLISLGIPKERIIAETESLDTSANIENALEIIKEAEGTDRDLKLGIVTNGFHVFRGVGIARKMTDAKVCGIAAYMQFRFIPNNMVRECFGIIRDLIAGKI